VADFSEAIRIDPGYDSPYYNRGLVYYDLGRHEQAIAEFRSYLELAPPDDEPWRTNAQQYIEEMQRQR
jgi:tetratricopeptide (TPR) repeat protein